LNASLKHLVRCLGVTLTLVASPAYAAGLNHMVGLSSAWAAVGQLGFGGNDARKESDQLLKQARAALTENKLDQAEQLVSRAEKLGAKYDPISSKFVETPASLRRDLTAARSKTAAAPKSAGASRVPSLLGSPGSTQNAPPPADPFARRAAGDAAIAAMTDDSHAKAKQWLELGRQALAQGNVTEAQACYQKASSFKASFAPGEYSLDQFSADLKKAGVDLSQLPAAAPPSPFTLRPSDMSNESNAGYPSAKTPSSPAAYSSAFGETEVNPNNLPAERNPLAASPANTRANAPVMQRLPAVENTPAPAANPAATAPAGAKEEALRLTAQARAAKDRGEFEAAYRLAERAQALNVPESAFGRDETRPWQVLMEINREMARRGGVQQASSAQGAPAGGDFPVSPGVYDPQRDPTRVVPVQGEGLANETVVERNPNALKAEKLMNEGLDALQNGDRPAAIAKFQEAWRYQDLLDPQMRQDLKDKLAFLSNAPASAPAREAVPGPAENMDPEQYLRYQKLLREVSAEREAAQKLANDDPRKALQNLRDLRERVAGAELDPAARKQLLTILDRSNKELEAYIEQNRGDIELRERNSEVKAELQRSREMTVETQNKLAELVEQFNQLMDENRYAEAEVLAKQARELAPESSIAEMLTWKSHFAKNVAGQMSLKDQAERGFIGAMEAIDESKIPIDDRNPFQFGDVKTWNALTRDRRRLMQEFDRKLSPAEMDIDRSLGKQVEVNFEERPLSEVLDTLSKMAGINIHLDPQGLHAEAVTSDTPVTLKLTNPVSLKSALNLVLGQLRLSYVIENEVLLITSKDTRDSHTYQKVYYVADLVTPIPNFVPSYNIGLPGAIRESFNALGAYGPGRTGMGGSIPITVGQNEANGQMSQNASMLAQMGGAQMQGKDGSPMPIPMSNAGTRMAQPLGGYGPGGLGGGVIADFDTLIDLITTTISTDSWIDNGGQGSISGFPTNLSLVVSQTQDIHADIADLLQQLRRLQDLQVTIEVRFITLTDNFFERIGVDFDFRVDDNSNLALPPNTVIPDDDGQSYAIGLDPSGGPTSDLDFAFTQDTFASAVPQFGGFDPTNAANFGFAILSDIEVFFLLQAIQGDTRTNVLQAPKVTLFNGQQAFVRDSTDRPFVTQIIPVVGDFAAAQQPVVTVLSEGTSLSVQAVVSSDRRFVRLTLVPMFTKIGEVDTFTFNGRTTSNSGTTAQDPTDPTKSVKNGSQTTTEGTTVQLPSLNVTTVSTTVSVPDGGTVLLGGIKRLQEGRNERGVPLLSKVPYISRLFKNVGIGRTTQSLMMMVTPRIIIQEEEEEKLGLDIEP
jgi:general secretion pathway protein D